jgi:translation elongation factor EF-Tu-like GTPase
LKQRGLVIAGWIEKDSVKLSLGNAVRIVRPDGTAIETIVSGIESFIKRKCFSETSKGENRAFLLRD